jgi:hypothetical protein
MLRTLLADLRRRALPAATFAVGIVFGFRSVHPLWQTLLVGVVGFGTIYALIEWALAPDPPRPPTPLPPEPAAADERPAWLRKEAS